jgi:NAD(P)-dependent dehydrogenase (short-subunit alcohol dehydrogenase family)
MLPGVDDNRRIATVTGASRGLGLALARALAADGWELLVDARDAESLRRAVAGLGDHVTAVAGDVADASHRREIAEIIRRAGRLDLLVNNAGALGPSPLPTLDRYPLEELERVFRVNTIAPLALIQLMLPALTASSGIVIDITSDAAVEPYPGWGGYGSSKAALEQITAVLAAEQPGISVYTFDPGDMRTKMHQDAFPGEDISDRAEPEFVIPALLRLIDERPSSGRYRASDLLVRAGDSA